MKIADGRGKYKIKQGKRNRALIKEFFKNNPNATKTDCKNALDLSFLTIRQHLSALESEKK